MSSSSQANQGRGLVHRMLAAQNRERKRVVAEIFRVKGFMPLLMKSRNGERWTAAERTELVEQLRAISHLSPYLFIMILPGSFLALPVLAWWLDRRHMQRTRVPQSD